VFEAVSDSIAETQFKASQGRLARSPRYEVDETGGAVWIDKTIAPHASHVEHGVRRHEMRYLLKATSPIPIRLPGGKMLYRYATPKWMGRPHPAWDYEGSERLQTQMMTKGWIHPGYPGKFYFRTGVQEGMRRVREKQRRVVFRVMDVGFSSARVA